VSCLTNRFNTFVWVERRKTEQRRFTLLTQGFLYRDDRNPLEEFA
jgi:hypothetical protein